MQHFSDFRCRNICSSSEFCIFIWLNLIALNILNEPETQTTDDFLVETGADDPATDPCRMVYDASERMQRSMDETNAAAPIKSTDVCHDSISCKEYVFLRIRNNVSFHPSGNDLSR